MNVHFYFHAYKRTHLNPYFRVHVRVFKPEPEPKLELEKLDSKTRKWTWKPLSYPGFKINWFLNFFNTNMYLKFKNTIFFNSYLNMQYIYFFIFQWVSYNITKIININKSVFSFQKIYKLTFLFYYINLCSKLLIFISKFYLIKLN